MHVRMNHAIGSLTLCVGLLGLVAGGCAGSDTSFPNQSGRAGAGGGTAGTAGRGGASGSGGAAGSGGTAGRPNVGGAGTGGTGGDSSKCDAAFCPNTGINQPCCIPATDECGELVNGDCVTPTGPDP